MTFNEIRKRAQSEWDALRGNTYMLVSAATCGRAAGALDVVDALNTELARRGLEVPVIQSGCTELCYADPVVVICKPDGLNIVYGNVTPDLVPRIVEGYVAGDDPCLELALGTLESDDEGAFYIPELTRFEHEHRLILRRCGYIDPENIDHYIADGGYNGLEQALKMSPEAIIEELERAQLRGRGGAGFPAYRKWASCRHARGNTRYVICNADEGDPGAFMDRVVLESDPHQVIEGMIIAGCAVGATQGYVYVRAEYPLAIERVQTALKQAAESGLLGENILDSNVTFNIEIAAGAGAFVSGESTSLVAAMEGRRSEPRTRPPRLAESGLWRKPTLLNNVKTFAYVPSIVTRGADWFASSGTEGSKGTAVFALAGKIVNPGLAEVSMGTTLRTLIYDIGGGIARERQFKAVQIGGPSGGCLPETLLDIPIDYDSLCEAGSMMGSGGMIVMDEDNCMVDAAKFFLDFSTRESCGKCTMCRLGTLQLLRLLEDITAGRGRMQDLDLLLALAEDTRAGSLCGLGKTAPNPILTTLRYFREEYEAHIVEKRCPARVCPELTAYYILPEACDRACEHCLLTCPTEAITGGKGEVKVIDQEKCSKCGTCLEVCPPEYNAVVKLSPVSSLPPPKSPERRREE